MKVEYSETTGTLYFYEPGAGATPLEDMAQYSGVCTVVWLWRGAVFLKALRADLSREMRMLLLDWMIERGVAVVFAERQPGRTLPMARRVDDHYEIDVAELARRMRSPSAAFAAPRRGESGPPPPRRRRTDPADDAADAADRAAR